MPIPFQPKPQEGVLILSRSQIGPKKAIHQNRERSSGTGKGDSERGDGLILERRLRLLGTWNCPELALYAFTLIGCRHTCQEYSTKLVIL